jgi:spoIIIJ-associated protein
VEASGKSIEDAILQALVRLGRTRDEVDVTVLQEPVRGSRHGSAREARVRVALKPVRGARGAVVSPDMAGALLNEEEAEEPAEAGSYVPAEQAGEYEEEDYAAVDLTTTGPLKDILPEDASIEEVALAALRLLLAHMGIRANIEVVEPEDETEEDEAPIVFNIRSGDPGMLGLLIGKRGETLASLQLIVNLIVAKQTGVHERIIVDAEHYRERREDNLRAMAQRIAQQVRRSGRSVMLEAMPPNERRIVHIALKDSDDISTESTGEGDQRRVVVSLKPGVRS